VIPLKRASGWDGQHRDYLLKALFGHGAHSLSRLQLRLPDGYTGGDAVLHVCVAMARDGGGRFGRTSFRDCQCNARFQRLTRANAGRFTSMSPHPDAISKPALPQDHLLSMLQTHNITLVYTVVESRKSNSITSLHKKRKEVVIYTASVSSQARHVNS
jgi:hypothetical protein